MPKQLIITLVVLFFVTLLTITLLAKGCSPVPTLEKKPIAYPTRPVTMIIPFAAGGGMDLQARSIESLFKKYLNESLIVVNKPGGSGIIGWNELVSSDADGYTLGISAVDLVLHSFLKSDKYHYPTALDPIAQLSTLPLVIAVNTTSPHKNLKELITYAKENSYHFKFGHSGFTTPSYILGRVIENATKITFDYVPFKGGSEITAALIGNHIQITCTSPSVLKEQIRAGILRPLAITGDKRLSDPTLSNIPTLKELGFDIVFHDWRGVASPKPLPPEIKEKLDKGFEQIVADPEFKRNMDNLGLEINYLNAADSQKKWVAETHKVKKWLTETGILEQIEKENQAKQQ